MLDWFDKNKQNWCLLWICIHHSLGMGLIFIASKDILINPINSACLLLCCFGICVPVAWYYTKEYSKDCTYCSFMES